MSKKFKCISFKQDMIKLSLNCESANNQIEINTLDNTKQFVLDK